MKVGEEIRIKLNVANENGVPISDITACDFNESYFVQGGTVYEDAIIYDAPDILKFSTKNSGVVNIKPIARCNDRYVELMCSPC